MSLGGAMVCAFRRIAPKAAKAINAQVEMSRVWLYGDLLKSMTNGQMHSMQSGSNGGVLKLYCATMPVMKPAATMASGLRKRKYSLREALRIR